MPFLQGYISKYASVFPLMVHLSLKGLHAFEVDWAAILLETFRIGSLS